eukprot:gene5339-7409_t
MSDIPKSNEIDVTKSLPIDNVVIDNSELKKMKARLKGLELILQQNSALERQVERLCAELDEATMGIQLKGYLYKWRDRVISYASKWGLRYFVLQGSKLSYFADDHEIRPRRTYDLSKCFVRDEGMKKNGAFHVFGIYLYAGDTDEEGSLLLRLSIANEADAKQWVDMLDQACSMNEMVSIEQLDENSITQVHVHSNDDEWNVNHELENLDANDNQDRSDLPAAMLKRVESSKLILRKAMSRKTNARKILSSRAPNDYTQSGNRLNMLTDSKSQHDKSGGDMKSFPGYKPMHLTAIASPLSADAKPGEHNFRGFFNLGIIILVLSHFDLIINNMTKYGFQLKWVVTYILSSQVVPQIATAESISAFHNQILEKYSFDNMKIIISLSGWLFAALSSYSLEYLASKDILPEMIVRLLSISMNSFNIIFPTWWVWHNNVHPIPNMMYLFQSVIIWMKLISYAHANQDLRASAKRFKDTGSNSGPNSPVSRSRMNSSSNLAYNNSKLHLPIGSSSSQLQQLISEVKDIQPPFNLYPFNITLFNLGYFLIAPTLCYQLNYPRSPTIRWRYVMLIIIRLVFVGFLIIFSFEQYIRPTLKTAVTPMKEKDIVLIFERLLKLSIPNTYVWLLGFYFYFHLWLNLLAELTRFGDRQFYKDWWNARTIDRYWRTWNLPVHHWIIRHLYYPLTRAGLSRIVATFIAFAFSAVMHELVISVPFRYVALHAFFGMLAQAPLVYLTKRLDRVFDNSFFGNACFWCIFCVFGQPMGLIMYYYDLWSISPANS